MKAWTRREFLAGVAAGTVVGAEGVGALVQAATKASEPGPNILWITCEDMSPVLGCFGDAEARTPNLDRLATEGVRYTNAFSVAGVCAPSRSCLITGMYPPSLGTCHMRCKNPPPDHVRCFPAYLRGAGYYCSNNVKTDYNFDVPPDAWDDCSKTAHWRNRPDKNKPFFSVFNFTITHESQVGNLDALSPDLSKAIEHLRHDPTHAKLPPYYPDTEVIRRHWAHLYDLVSAMDREAGGILRQLEEDGLADTTLVFFFSDHGNGLPRAKRWLYDSGLRVPLIIRHPGRNGAGTIDDRLVSFVDFGPTVLSAAGVAVPAHMQGRPFLGTFEGPPREYAFAARDRMDATYDLIRAATDGRYKYIRNYEPRRPYDQYITYNESWPIMQEMRRVEAAGALTPEQQLFFRDAKPLEELYDTHRDPHELNNLADSVEHRNHLDRFRVAMETWLDESKDLGFVPEPRLQDWLPAGKVVPAPDPRPRYVAPEGESTIFGQSLSAWVAQLNGDNALKRIRAAATLGLDAVSTESILTAALKDPDPCVAYWAATGLGNSRPLSAEVKAALTHGLDHTDALVRLGTARTVALETPDERAIAVIVACLADENAAMRLLAADALDRLEDKPEIVMKAFERALDDKDQYVVRMVRHGLGLPPQR